MGFDIKAKVDEIVNKVKADPNLAEKFKSNPTQAISEISGINIPEDQVKPVITAVQAKLTAGNIGDAVSGLGNLFKK